MFDNLFKTSPKPMIMLGAGCFDLAKVQRFHYYDKKKRYYIYVRFEDGDEVTVHYDSAELRDNAFKTLRQAYCLYTDEERAEAVKTVKEATKKKDESKDSISGIAYKTVPAESLTSRLDVRSND